MRWDNIRRMNIRPLLDAPRAAPATDNASDLRPSHGIAQSAFAVPESPTSSPPAGASEQDWRISRTSPWGAIAGVGSADLGIFRRHGKARDARAYARHIARFGLIPRPSRLRRSSPSLRADDAQQIDLSWHAEGLAQRNGSLAICERAGAPAWRTRLLNSKRIGFRRWYNSPAPDSPMPMIPGQSRMRASRMQSVFAVPLVAGWVKRDRNLRLKGI